MKEDVIRWTEVVAAAAQKVDQFLAGIRLPYDETHSITFTMEQVKKIIQRTYETGFMAGVHWLHHRQESPE